MEGKPKLRRREPRYIVRFDPATCPTSCSDCSAQMEPGTQTDVFCRFSEPLKSTIPGYPDCDGVWVEICPSCLAKRLARGEEVETRERKRGN